MKIIMSLFLLFLVTTTSAFDFPDELSEKRYNDLTYKLRCLVCQNQNIADSNAPLAVDLKNIVFKMVTEGDSDREIIDFMTERYGDFVLYEPPMRAYTYALWLLPYFLLFCLGLGFFIFAMSKRKKTVKAEDS